MADTNQFWEIPRRASSDLHRKSQTGTLLLGLNYLILAVFLVGCQAVRNGGAPEPSFNVNKDLEQLAKQYGEASTIDGFYEKPSKEARDKFIAGRLVMMNIRYIQFVRQTTSEKQFLDSAVDILTLSLSLAGAAVDRAQTKTVLAAIAAGLVGSKAVIDKNFFYDKTIPALIAAMNAQRKKALFPILSGMTNNLDDYPFAQAITDLHDYYFAGTFLGAIQAIQSDSAVKEGQQNAKIENIRKLSVITPEDVVTKGSLTDAIGKAMVGDLDKLKVALKSLDAEKYKEPASLDDAKSQLQAHVRTASSSSQIAKVAAAFKQAKLIE